MLAIPQPSAYDAFMNNQSDQKWILIGAVVIGLLSLCGLAFILLFLFGFGFAVRPLAPSALLPSFSLAVMLVKFY